MKAPWLLNACLAMTIDAGWLATLTNADDLNQPASAESEAEPALQDSKATNSARDRAILMHDIYASTLHVMHVRYFHGDRTIVPARAMEDIFADIKKSSGVEARWISVNLEPMSLDHKPNDDFEKQAAKQLAAGKTAVEAVENGVFRRAVAIPLTSGCINCHQGSFRNASTARKFAGLVINIPLAGPTPSR